MNNKIKKIIITGQMLRGDTFSARWIYSLFSYYIKRVTNLDVYLTVPRNASIVEDENFIGIDIETIYKNLGIDFLVSSINRQAWDKKWAQIYYKDFDEETMDYIKEIYKDSFVIGYEMEACKIKAFEKLNIPYLDINLDPIRFLDDIMLCFKTPIKEIYEKFLKYRVDEEYLYLSANYVKSFYQLHNRSYSNASNLLFLGQTTCDKTIIDSKTNELYSILNHKEQFEKAISGFDNIYYKRHPLVRNDKEIIDYIKSLRNVEIVTGNFYEFISRRNIKKVISISSGTCSEAKYFNKETQTLLQEGVPRQTKDEFDKDKYVSVYQSFFSLNFWSEILSPIIKTEKFDKEITIAGVPNRLRNSRQKRYSAYYAYEDLNHLAIKEQINKEMNAKMQTAFFAQKLEQFGEIEC